MRKLSRFITNRKSWYYLTKVTKFHSFSSLVVKIISSKRSCVAPDLQCGVICRFFFLCGGLDDGRQDEVDDKHSDEVCENDENSENNHSTGCSTDDHFLEREEQKKKQGWLNDAVR